MKSDHSHNSCKPKALVAAILLLLCNAALAGEQYRSRMYIDIEQDATENVAMSVSELEKQIDTLQDDYARASAEKFLAQHYANQKDYPKAIQHLEDALKHPGMADNTRRDMLADLSRLYLLQKDYDRAGNAIARYLATNPPESADMYVLLAQIHYKNKKYVDSAAALDKVLLLDKNPSKELLQSALSIYYSIGAYDKSAQIIQQLVERDLNNAELWQQWISLLLKSGKQSQALDVMSLAWEKGIPFRDQDILLLCDLYSLNKTPGRGARVLEAAIASGRINAQGESAKKIHDRLFRLWLQAGERDKAQKALEKAAQVGGDKELQLHLAQLYMEKEQWKPMQDMVLKACDSPLPDVLVSRANLFLGISQLKLGENELARRSFINATILGGENENAGKWLNYMQAEPASEREKIGISGPCYSNSTRSIWSASLPNIKNVMKPNEDDDESDVKNETIAEIKKGTQENTDVKDAGPVVTYADLLAQKKGDPNATVNSKTTSSQKLYLGDYSLTPDEFAEKVLPQAMRMGISISKGGGKIIGPMHFIYPEPPSAEGKIKVRFGFPVSGNPKSTSGFRLVNDKPFKCVWRKYQGTAEGVAGAFAQLYLDAQVKGYSFTGESRQLAGNENTPDSKIISLELQIGIKP